MSRTGDDPGTAPDETTDQTLAARIDRLRRATADDPSKPPSWAQIAFEINAAAGENVISGVYAWQLGTGQKDNPTRNHLGRIAQHFGVDPSFLISSSPGAVRAAALAVGTDGEESPLKTLLQFIAQHFGVDRNYFLDAEVQRQVDADLAFLEAVTSGAVRSIAARAEHLSAANKEEVSRFVNRLRLEEGLDLS